MAKNSRKHYDISNLLSKQAMYNLLYGERSNGKSYQVKYLVLRDAIEHEDRKFIYLRRWREDITGNRALEYFNDMVEDDEGNTRIKELTNGEYDFLVIKSNRIYLATKDEKDKTITGTQIGYVMVLSGDTHYKSMAFVGYENIVFEEFITNTGYLGDEVKTFMSIVSTVFRRRKGKVFMIGNTMSKHCPYFREWQLTNIKRQKIGEIDIYNYHTGTYDGENEIIIRIACEYCPNSAIKTKSVFGSKMITGGEWDTREYPHLPALYSECRRFFSILFINETENFVIDMMTHNKYPFLYVRPYDKLWFPIEKFRYVITEEFKSERKYIRKLSLDNKEHRFVISLFKQKDVVYSDNLTGTTFNDIIINRNIY